MDQTNETIEYALKYAALGLKVFPLKPHKKEPAHNGWQQEATDDPETIKAMFSGTNYNIGIATGTASNLLIIDVDNKNGEDGSGSLRAWEQENGNLPETATVISGTGGYHYYYKTKEVLQGRSGTNQPIDGVDIRAEGNLIVCPPSLHPNGNNYEWDAGADIDDIGITEADDTVLKLARWNDSSKEKHESFQLQEVIPEGQRDSQLFRYAASLWRKRTPVRILTEKVFTANRDRCNPPLPEDEVQMNIIDQVTLNYKAGANDIPDEKPSYPMINYRGIRFIAEYSNSKKCYVMRQCSMNMFYAMEGDTRIQGIIRYNEMSEQPEYSGQLEWHDKGDTSGAWTDTDDSYVRSMLDTDYNLKSKSQYDDAFRMVSNAHRFNPVRDWLEDLPKWNGHSTISNLLPTYLGVEKNDYSAAVMKTFMLGAISRIYDPGCQFDLVLLIIGEQGIGKTSFGRHLAINPEWYEDNYSTFEGDKAFEKLSGKWIVEIGEFSAIKSAKDIETVKAFLTSRADQYRVPYDRHPHRIPRKCVFMATTNEGEILTDVTGNRRFLPVFADMSKVQISINSKENKEIVDDDFVNAWAEALYIYKNENPSLELPDDIQAIAKEQQEKYEAEDPFLAPIKEFLETYSGRVCAQLLWEDALKMPGIPKRSESQRINNLLVHKCEGWEECKNKERVGSYGITRAFERSLIDAGDDIPF